MKIVSLLASLGVTAAYVNNFNTSDNPFGILLPGNPADAADLRNRSVVFLVADFGLPSTADPKSPCCQTMVADAMRARRASLEAQGKSLLFVGAAGDNFYWTGLGSGEAGGSGLAQWKRWAAVYAGLTDVPWLGAFGNHDYGDSDPYATCPWNSSAPVTVDGQPYGSHQLDADKGGYRPTLQVPSCANFHLPDFNYRATLSALNLEVLGLDQNFNDDGGIGGDASGHALVDEVCGGGANLKARLKDVGAAGQALLEASAGAPGPGSDQAAARNVLLLQHYPHVCGGLAASFAAGHAIASPGQPLDVRCAFGHVHDTFCETPAADEAEDCVNVMVGGGGGCCDGDPVTAGSAGFGVLTFNADGSGMAVEQVLLGQSCSMWPTDHVLTAVDRSMTAQTRAKRAREAHL